MATRIMTKTLRVNYCLLSFLERGFSSELIPSKNRRPKIKAKAIRRQKLIIAKVACKICIPFQHYSSG
jgi:hypothetical protein